MKKEIRMSNKKKHNRLLLALLAVAAFSCERTQNLLGPNQNQLMTADFASIQQQVLTPSCAVAGCHVQGAVAPDLTAGNAYNNLVGVQSIGSIAPRVQAGSADSSQMFQKMLGGGVRTAGVNFGGQMPPTGILQQSILDSVGAWIDRGALNNGPAVMNASLSQIQNAIIAPNCLGCHGANLQNGAPMSLQNIDSTYANLVNKRSIRSVLTDTLRVVPGDTLNSYFVRLLKGNGNAASRQMPPLAVNNPLPPAQIQMVTSWIANGAPKYATPAPPATLTQIQGVFINNSCAVSGCHLDPIGAGVPFSLTTKDSTYKYLVNKRSLRSVLADSILVVPGNSGLSYLMRQLNGAGNSASPVMPPAGPMLQQNIQQIQSWIDAGALNN